MNYRIFLIIVTLVLSSCGPMATALPTKSPTLTSTIISTQTEVPTSYPTPLPTLLIDPFQIPTPINTLHPVPTALSQDSDPIALHDQRVENFENTLSFKLTISGVGFEMQGAPRYIVIAEGILTNISNKPIVVRRELSSGHTLNEDVNWKLSYDGKRLYCPIERYHSFPKLSANDFVILQPSEFQKYLFAFWLPLALPDDESHEISLSNKRIQLTAIYRGYHVGYSETFLAPYKDMNAWIGLVESNSVEYVFP